jgi:hypothetical protein
MPVPKVPAQLLVPIETEAGEYDEKHVLTVSRLSGFCFGRLQPARHSRLAVIVVAAVEYRWTAQTAWNYRVSGPPTLAGLADGLESSRRPNRRFDGLALLGETDIAAPC